MWKTGMCSQDRELLDVKSTRADLKESYFRGWKDKMKDTFQICEQTEIENKRSKKKKKGIR